LKQGRTHPLLDGEGQVDEHFNPQQVVACFGVMGTENACTPCEIVGIDVTSSVLALDSTAADCEYCCCTKRPAIIAG